MISTLVIVAASAAWGVIHSWLASLGLKERLNRRFGGPATRFYRLGYNIFAGISLLPVFAAALLLPDRPLYRVPMPWTLFLLALQVAGLGLVLAGLRQTGAGAFVGLTQALHGAQGSVTRLVTSGPYRLVRHPLYLGGLVFLWAAPLMTRNVLVLVICFTLYLILGAVVEERKLLREFGQEYASYCKRTPMIIPWPRPRL